MATYPAAIRSFTNKVDNTDTVIASDVNLLYDEVTQIETTVGITPATTLGWSGTFDQATTNFTTVAARLQNVEYGLNTAFNARVKTTGGSTIASTSTTVGMTYQTSGTGNLVNYNNTSGTTITSITKDGWISAIDGGSAS
jgi:hypothetical protein